MYRSGIFTLQGLLCVMLAFGCARGGSDDGAATALLLLFAAASSDRADIYPELGFPGTTNDVSGEGFTGASADYAVTIGGASATGVSLVNSTTVRFTMPEIAGVTENATVPIVITRSGATVLSKTIRYRPAPVIALNAPNVYSRKLNALDTSSFFKFTATTGAHLVNVFGYALSDLDLYYLSSPTATPVALATNSMTDSEFKRVSLTAGTYYLQVKWVTGVFDTYYRTNIANGPITPASTSNSIFSSLLCYDFMGSGTAADSASSCASQNGPPPGYNLTGYCTYPSSGGINTRSYYIRTADGYGFDAGYAETTCTQPGFDSPNPDQAIWTP